MSRVASDFLRVSGWFFPPCLSRAGASHMRRVIRRRSVGWRPPDGRPSGAGLARGTRRPAGLFPRSRVAPLRGGVSAEARWSTCAVVGDMTSGQSAVGGHRHLLGHRPQKAREVPGHGHDHRHRVCATRDDASRALTPPDVGCPAAVLEDVRGLFEPPWQVAADLRRIARGPGPCDQGASGLGVASVSARPLPASRTAGRC